MLQPAPRVSAQQLSEVVVGAHREGGWKQGVGPGVLGCLIVIDLWLRSGRPVVPFLDVSIPVLLKGPWSGEADV